MIWTHESGDRADGGLRRLYAEEKQLILEMYEPERSNGACCPASYSKFAYSWNGKTFAMKGKEKTLPHPDRAAHFLATESECP